MSEKMSAGELERVRGWASEGGSPYNRALGALVAHVDALQREAGELREALTKLREACEPFQTEVSSWAPDFPPNGVALGDHDPALSVTWGDLLLLDIAAMDARAALNVPPQAPALEDNNGI